MVATPDNLNNNIEGLENLAQEAELIAKQLEELKGKAYDPKVFEEIRQNGDKADNETLDKFLALENESDAAVEDAMALLAEEKSEGRTPESFETGFDAETVMRDLVDGASVEVMRTLVYQDVLPVDVQRVLLDSGDSEVIIGLAKYGNLDESIQKDILKRQNPRELYELAYNKSLTNVVGEALFVAVAEKYDAGADAGSSIYSYWDILSGLSYQYSPMLSDDLINRIREKIYGDEYMNEVNEAEEEFMKDLDREMYKRSRWAYLDNLKTTHDGNEIADVIREYVEYSETSSFKEIEAISKNSDPDLRYQILEIEDRFWNELYGISQDEAYPARFGGEYLGELISKISDPRSRENARRMNTRIEVVYGRLYRAASAEDNIDALTALAGSPNVPLRILEELALNSNSDVKIAILHQGDEAGLSNETYDRLAQDPDPKVREAFARHLYITPEREAVMLLDSSPLVLRALVTNNSLSEKGTLELIENNDSVELLNAAAEGINLSEAIVAALESALAPDISRLKLNSFLPESVVDRYYQEYLDAAESDPAAEEYLIAYASGYYTSKATLDRLADEPFVSVREAVAENSITSEETLLKLARDQEDSVRLAVLDNPNWGRQY